MPNKQTIASAKYQKKAGYVAYSVKLKKELIDEFKLAVEKNGDSQAKVIRVFMEEYIKLGAKK